MPTLNDYLLLSTLVYGDESGGFIDETVGGWTRIADTDALGFTSGLSAAAYQRGNEVVIVYRGWDKQDPEDLDDITKAYAGDPFEQIRDAQAFFDQVKALEPDASISLTGHSLGGGLASAIAVRENLTATVFAPIATTYAVYDSLKGTPTEEPGGPPIFIDPPIPPAHKNQDFSAAQVAN